MRTYLQVKDVLREIRLAHSRMRDALCDSRSEAVDGRARWMFEELCRDEDRMRRALRDYESDGDPAVLNTWLQYVPVDEPLAALRLIDFDGDLSIEEIVERKLEFDRLLAEMLRLLAEETSVDRVRNLFASLREFTASQAAQSNWKLQECQPDSLAPNPEG